MNGKGVTSRGRLINFGGMALVVSSVIAKLLGAVYRIPLTNILGAEGIGMYQLVFPIYALMLTLSSSGIPTAIARLVSEKNALKDVDGVIGIVKTSAILLTILGTFFMILLMSIASPLAGLQGNEYLRIGYMAIAPSILIVAGSSVFKGYFQGMMNLTPTALSGLIEQVVKMGVGLVLASYLLRYGIVYAVTGAVIGLTIAEAVSFFIMLGIYLKHKTSKIDGHIYHFRRYGEDILRVSLPIALSGIVFPIMQVIDSILIVNILQNIGIEQGRATALYGLLTGPVNTLINMPIVVTLALSIMVVPVISEGRIRRDADTVKAKCVTAIKLSYIIGIPAFLGMFVMADRIMTLLYPALSDADLTLSAGLLRVSSVSILLLAEVQIYTSLLEALDKTRVSMWALIVSAVVKVILSIVLIRYMSIVGASIASILTYLLIVTIDSIYLRRYLGKNEGLFTSLVKSLMAGLFMAVTVYLVALPIQNNYLSLAVAVILGVALYTFFMLLLRVMNASEMLSLPFGRFFVMLDRKIHFREKGNDKDNRTGNS